MKKGQSAHGDPLFNRFWLMLGEPLQHWPPSDSATDVQETAARQLLRKTLRQCKAHMPETRRYLLGDIHDVGYLGCLLRLQQQLQKERWCDACYTLCKVIKYYCANDIRTMYTIIGLLEEYL